MTKTKGRQKPTKAIAASVALEEKRKSDRREERWWFREFMWDHCVRFQTLADMNDNDGRIRLGSPWSGFDFRVINDRQFPSLLVLVVTEPPTPEQIRELSEAQRIHPKHTGLFAIYGDKTYRAMTLADVEGPDPLKQSKPFLEYLHQTKHEWR
jgi:hypothetical protein